MDRLECLPGLGDLSAQLTVTSCALIEAILTVAIYLFIGYMDVNLLNVQPKHLGLECKLNKHKSLCYAVNVKVWHVGCTMSVLIHGNLVCVCVCRLINSFSSI